MPANLSPNAIVCFTGKSAHARSVMVGFASRVNLTTTENIKVAHVLVIGNGSNPNKPTGKRKQAIATGLPCISETEFFQWIERLHRDAAAGDGDDRPPVATRPAVKPSADPNAVLAQWHPPPSMHTCKL